ncbi:MAG: type II toxin-antitoxin system RelE/ParE family toxin [Euryarchaeota archaeon]|nr:type II toxin-antitoxin system RelE/ParE family toxin [Euryarchaeota archaeon]
MVEVYFTNPAKDQLASLEKKVRVRIYSKLEEIKDWPEHFLKPLTGYPYFRLRVGDYRVIIDWHKDRDQLWVVAVGHRKNIYENNF